MQPKAAAQTERPLVGLGGHQHTGLVPHGLRPICRARDSRCACANVYVLRSTREDAFGLHCLYVCFASTHSHRTICGLFPTATPRCLPAKTWCHLAERCLATPQLAIPGYTFEARLAENKPVSSF